jgi:hypothetical protein
MYGSATPASPAFDVNGLLAKLQGLSGQANNAGLQQFRRLMGATNRIGQKQFGPNGLYNQAIGAQSQMGNTAHQQVADTTAQNAAQADQDLVSRGLGNTTVRSSVQRGIQSDAMKQNQAINESVANAKSGLLSQQAGALENYGNFKANSILSKQNVPPDLQMYMSLIQQLAASGGAGALGAAGATNQRLSPSDIIGRNPQLPGESTPDYYKRIGLGG